MGARNQNMVYGPQIYNTTNIWWFKESVQVMQSAGEWYRALFRSQGKNGTLQSRHNPGNFSNMFAVGNTSFIHECVTNDDFSEPAWS